LGYKRVCQELGRSLCFWGSYEDAFSIDSKGVTFQTFLEEDFRLKTIIVTDQRKDILSIRSDKVIVIVSRNLEINKEIQREINLMVQRSQGIVEYIWTDEL